MSDDEDAVYEWEEWSHPHMEDCTCEHDADQHDWGHCTVEGCPCEGGWTE